MHNIAKSAVRALDILELLVEAGQPHRAIEIARSLAISPSSTHQLLKTMMDSGYLNFDASSKRYHLPARLMRLGALLRATYFDPDSIDRLMRSVQTAVGGTVLLAASQGLFMQVIDACRSPDLGTPRKSEPVIKGLHTPYFGSCTGAAWLSTQSEKTIRRLIQKCRRELGQRASDVACILESIRRVRKQGYAFGGFRSDDGIWSVAVPLPPAGNGMVLVLVVCGAACTIDERKAEIAALMKRRIQFYLEPSAIAARGG